VSWELPDGAALENPQRSGGTSGYRDLASDADKLTIADTPRRVASVIDLTRMAGASQAPAGGSSSPHCTRSSTRADSDPTACSPPTPRKARPR
jgi:hypothetical protein